MKHRNLKKDLSSVSRAALALMLALCLAGTLSLPPVTLQAPVFDAQDMTPAQQRFVNELIPVIHRENTRIAQKRVRLLALLAREEAGQSLDLSERRWIQELGQEYEVDFGVGEHAARRGILLRRVDTVPVSLVLAQAIHESAWGTSRFARQGRNLFGQWCFKKGCGLVPRQRSEGLTHEVQVFDSAALSVRAYLHNLNTNETYQDFRKLRQAGPAQPARLAAGLKGYSARGRAYVLALVDLIEDYGLAALDVAPDSRLAEALGQNSKS